MYLLELTLSKLTCVKTVIDDNNYIEIYLVLSHFTNMFHASGGFSFRIYSNISQCSVKLLHCKYSIIGKPTMISENVLTRAPHADANSRLKLHLENSKSKKGYKFVKKDWRITYPTGMSPHFYSEQLLCVSSKYLQ